MSLPKDTERDPHADALLTSALHAADGVEAGDCPDAEVIGLFADRALAGAELHEVEAHVHTCPRCQATVAAFVRALPDETAVEAAGAVAGADGASSGGGFAAWFAGWRWLVPATSLTAVALVAVWVGRSPADRVAESARVPAATVETDAAAPARESALAPRPEGVVPPAGAAGGSGLTAGRQSRAVPADGGSTEVSGRLSRPAETPPVAAPAGEAAASAMAGARAKSAPSLEARREMAGALSDRGAVANDVSREAAVGAARGAAPAAAPLPEALSVTSASAPPPPAAVAPSAAPTFRANLVFVPWRVSEGLVERSRDSGRTWQHIATPAGVRIIAVASPGGDICWAIAEDGVLRTTDGGTWTRTARPAAERLARIVATSAGDASVFTTAGARFVTTDGGATWTPAP